MSGCNKDKIMYLNKPLNSSRSKSSIVALSVAMTLVIMVFSVGALADDKLTYGITTRTLKTVSSATHYVIKEFKVRGSSLKINVEKKLQLD
jgi:hypothetical protein